MKGENEYVLTTEERKLIAKWCGKKLYEIPPIKKSIYNEEKTTRNIEFDIQSFWDDYIGP